MLGSSLTEPNSRVADCAIVRVMKRPTAEEIETAKTPKGGWTKKTLGSWGVAWPPPKGWKEELLEETPLYIKDL